MFKTRWDAFERDRLWPVKLSGLLLIIQRAAYTGLVLDIGGMGSLDASADVRLGLTIVQDLGNPQGSTDHIPSIAASARSVCSTTESSSGTYLSSPATSMVFGRLPSFGPLLW